MEHEDPAWGVTRSITPSAINSWVGEEVKVWGVEATVRRGFGGHELEATAGLFGGNDTSGTLLTFRGWALHDVKATAFGHFPLPPLSPFMEVRQAPVTDPLWEIDGRAGHYVRLGWTPPGTVELQRLLLRQQRRPAGRARPAVGLAHAVLEPGRAARPRREDRGAGPGDERLDRDGLSPRTTAASGPTSTSARPICWSRARSAEGLVTGRIEGFEVEDRSLRALDDNEERGWAATAAYRRPIGAHLVWLVEASHVDSDRPSRALAGVAPEQAQTVVQTALRVVF